MNIVDIINACVRPIVTIIITLALVYGFLMGTISGDTFVAIGSMVIGFWFSKREEEKKLR